MFDDRSPIYQQIAEQVREAVLSGELAEGDQVMSTTQYAVSYRINPATAAKAMAILVDEGLLEKRRGVGMFVRDGARDALVADRRSTFFVDILDPVLVQAGLLGIDRSAIVSHIEGAS